MTARPMPHRLASTAAATTLLALAALLLAGCGAFGIPPAPAPATFNQRALLAELSVTALTRSCASMLQDNIISTGRAVQCRDTAATAGDAIDAARALGPDAGADRLTAAQALVNTFRTDLEARR